MGLHRFTTSEVRERLKSQGRGISLLGEYTDTSTKHRFRCGKGHTWTTTPDSVFRGSGCRYCHWGQKTLSPKEVARKLRGKGVFLIGKYTGVNTRHKFRCREGHEWSTTPSSIFQGTGCPFCSKCRVDVGELDAKFRAKSIKRLTPYKGWNHRVTLLCLQCGRKWQAIPHPGSTGCSACAGNLRLKEGDVKSKLRKTNIKLLDEYRGVDFKHRLLCLRCGHKWSPTLTHILHDHSGCPECKFAFTSEKKIRNLIERITGWKFPKVKLRCLKGRGTRSLELDGYNARHGIAFEYQGEQHYRLVNFGGRDSKKNLRVRKLTDDRKRKLCRYHGMYLICVPYWKKDVEDFLKKKLEEAGYRF